MSRTNANSDKDAGKKPRGPRMGRATQLVGSFISTSEIEALSELDLSEGPATREALESKLSGPRERGETCASCLCQQNECSGHSLHMSIPPGSEFAHPYFVADGTIPAILNLYCYQCFKLSLAEKQREQSHRLRATFLLDQTAMETARLAVSTMEGVSKIKALAKITKKRPCGIAGHACTFFKKTTDRTIQQHLADAKLAEEPEIPISSMRLFLATISEHINTTPGMLKYLGLGSEVHFENLIIEAIYVLPLSARLAITFGDKRTESDMTTIYLYMLQQIKLIQITNPTETVTLEGYRKQLRDIYYTYIESDANLINKSKSGKKEVLKTLKSQMDGKKGLFHRNMMSSRTDNSGRTVIIGDDKLKPNECGIPLYMADKWRIKLEITEQNIDLANQLLADGIIKSIESQMKTAKGISIQTIKVDDNNRMSVSLRVGDLCTRSLVNGDIVVINRQPTLHRWSMIGLYAVIYPEEVLSIGLNSAVLKGLNGDYDGDEVHAHVPDSLQARAEVIAFMTPDKAPISDKSGANLFGVIQNTVYGIYKMTKEVKNIPENLWNYMARSVEDHDGVIIENRINYVLDNAPSIFAENKVSGISLWNNLTLLSLAFPPDFSYRVKGDKDAPPIVIDRGILVSGVIGGSISGAGTNSIIRHLFEFRGHAAINSYIHIMQQIVNKWIWQTGVTSSYSNYTANPALERRMQNKKDELIRQATELGQDNISGIFNKKVYRNLVINTLNDVPKEIEGLVAPIRTKFADEAAFKLFEFIMLEVNLVKQGRNTDFPPGALFRNQTVELALSKALTGLIQTKKQAIQTKVMAGSVFAAGTLRKTGQVVASNAITTQDQELRLVDAANNWIMQKIVPATITFLQQNVADPLDFSKFKDISAMEKATREADIIDIYDKFKSSGNELTMYEDPKPAVDPRLKYVQNLAGFDDKMSTVDLVKSGARGNVMQATQAGFGAGLQEMSGGPLKSALSGGTRVMINFIENDPSPMAKGLVSNALSFGLRAPEFFASAMPARETQTDTAFNTGKTGYMQKELMSSLGDFIFYADGSVRDERGRVVQYLYGGNGFDSSRMFKLGDNFSFVDVSQLIVQMDGELDALEKTEDNYTIKF